MSVFSCMYFFYTNIYIYVWHRGIPYSYKRLIAIILLLLLLSRLFYPVILPRVFPLFILPLIRIVLCDCSNIIYILKGKMGKRETEEFKNLLFPGKAVVAIIKLREMCLWFDLIFFVAIFISIRQEIKCNSLKLHDNFLTEYYSKEKTIFRLFLFYL